MQAVAGEASIRDGAYISDDDKHIKLEGVYVEPTGMLAALGESRIASAFFDENATAEISAAGEEALEPGGSEELRAGKEAHADTFSARGISTFVAAVRGPSVRARGKYREALRVAARDAVGAPFGGGSLAASAAARDGFDPDRDGLRPETVPGSPGMSQMQRNERMRVMDDAEPGTYLSRCSFTLKLWVVPGEFKPVDPASAEDYANGETYRGLLPGVPGAGLDDASGRRRGGSGNARDDTALARRRAALLWSRRTR